MAVFGDNCQIIAVIKIASNVTRMPSGPRVVGLFIIYHHIKGCIF